MGLLRKSFLGAAAILAVSALAFAGQPAKEPVKAPKPAKKNYVIGLVPKSAENPVFIAARTGAMDAAKELGDKYGVKIEIQWRAPNTENAQKQAEFVEQLANVADGIAVSASDAKKLQVAIDAAVDKGVQVVTFDSDVPGSKRFAYYGTDDFECGKSVATQLAKAMGAKPGVVAILAGNQNAPNLQARVRGVREGLKDHKNITILDTYYHAETPQDAVNKIEQVIGANPQITGWAFVGGWPLYTANALDKVAGKAKVVSVDALPATFTYLKNDQVEILLGQKVYEWGYESVRMLMEKLIENKQPSEAIVKAPLVPVTKSSVDEYAKNWDKWLGKSSEKK